jgi:hypothetical protein
MKKMFADLKKSSEENNALFKEGTSSGGIGEEMFNSLMNEFKAFKIEMGRFRDDSINNFKFIMEVLPKKADKEDL